MRSILNRKNKRAAIELSMTTIVIIVLSVTLLILGFVLVRSIMCSAIGFTGQVNDKVKDEINRLFSSTADEFTCIGQEGSPVAVIPGETNIIYCSIKADQEAKYKIDIVPNFDSSTIPRDQLRDWFRDREFNSRVAPGNENPLKVADIIIPDNAPEGLITLDVEVYRDSTFIGGAQLDYKVSRQGVIRGFIC